MTMKTAALLIFLCAGAALAESADNRISALWGKSGEAWTPASRLPDFSRAGYAGKLSTPPGNPPVIDVRRAGAKGDGITDDTAAFQQAIRSAQKGGVIFVPEGRYVITDVLEINRSGVLLRGQGPERSVLILPKPLSEIRPLANVDQVKTAYSFTGGFVLLKGTDRGARLAAVVNPAKRGETQLVLDSRGTLRAGDWVRLVMQDPGDRSLLRHLHGDRLDPGTDTVKMRSPVDWAARVVAFNGRRVTLDRPLRVDVRAEWKPELFALAPTLTESGVENIGFEFPGVPKRPHLQEEGYNAIQITGAVNCWVRNVIVTDADNGVIMGASRFCTVENFTVRAAKRTGLTGHHALWATSRTQDALFRRFDLKTTYVHDLTVEGFANGNVFTQGRGIAVNCDHHRNAPYENLFTDLDVGDPRRLLESSGREDRGPHSGARTTFWNIRGQGKFPGVPPAEHWPLINLIGVGNLTASKNPDGAWVESAAGTIAPSNLWEAQVSEAAKTR